MRERVVVRYSACFKQEVIGALEAGRFASVEAARVHFGIKGSRYDRPVVEASGA